MTYKIALVTHFIGLSILFGTVVVSFFLMSQFWKQLPLDKAKATVISSTVAGFSRLFGIGFILQLLSGITMMGLAHGGFGKQFWFQVKLFLILLIVLNAFTIGRRQYTMLAKTLSQEFYVAEKLATIRRNLNLFNTLQLAFFIGIFILSVFRFI